MSSELAPAFSTGMPGTLSDAAGPGGSSLDMVCKAVGTDTAILNALTSVVSNVAPISACPTGSAVGTVPYDSTPDDLRRVRIDVSWTRSAAGSVSQTTLLTNPK